MKRLGEGEYVSFPAPAVQWEYFLHLVSELKSQIPRPQRRATSKLVRQLERDRARQERHIFEPALALGLPAWDVTTQPRTDYERGVRVLFECMLRRYCDRAEADADIADFARAPAQHSPAHYRWLAGYQYCGWSQKTIADAANRDRAGVVRAIHRLAAELGLTLRPAANNDRSWTVARIRTYLCPL